MTDTADQVGTISPELSEAQWRRLEKYGTAMQANVGDILFAAGDQWYPVILVDGGRVEVVRPATDSLSEAVVVSYGPRAFVGELGALSGQRAFLTARVGTEGRLLRIDRLGLRAIMRDDDELSEVFLRTFWKRR